jgi:hypothetical protein
MDLETMVVVEPEDRTATLQDWQAVHGTGCAADGEEGKRRLAPGVGEEKIGGGGKATPGAADRAAAEYILGWKTDKDLPDHDPLREGDGHGGDAAAAARRRPYSWRGFFSGFLTLIDRNAVKGGSPLLGGGRRAFV